MTQQELQQLLPPTTPSVESDKHLPAAPLFGNPPNRLYMHHIENTHPLRTQGLRISKETGETSSAATLSKANGKMGNIPGETIKRQKSRLSWKGLSLRWIETYRLTQTCKLTAHSHDTTQHHFCKDMEVHGNESKTLQRRGRLYFLKNTL